MFAKIQKYSYDDGALERLSKGLPLDLEPNGYVELSIGQYFRMQKSLRKAEEYIRFTKARIAVPSGARWITVHPNGDDGEGTPILIQESGDGTAHVIAGAGGRINGLKLNKIKSKDEYQRAVEDKREREKTKKLESRLAEQKELAEMTKEQRAALKANKKIEKETEEQQRIARKKGKAEAEKEFVDYMNSTMDWAPDDIDEASDPGIQEVKRDLSDAIEREDEDAIKAIRKKLSVLKKAAARAKNSQRKHFLQAARDKVRQIQKEIIGDADLRAQVEERISETGAEEIMKTENTDAGKGFVTGYRDSAEEKGKLNEDSLKKEKSEVFEARMVEIAEENPALANMITKGIETNRAISSVVADIYEKEATPRKAIANIDAKAEILKKYLAMKSKIAQIEKEESDGGEADESSPEPEYGKGTKLDYRLLFDADLKDAAEAIQTERQAAIHSSLIETIKANPGGSGKWIANGNYAGFNSISLAALKDEGIDRDIVDILGVGASAELMAMKARAMLSPDEYSIFSEGMARYHQEVNEAIATDAVERGKELIARAESIKEEIDADPGDLAALQELNESRLNYLNEANRIVGQALGSLEASAAMVMELKKKKDPESLEINLGKISTEDAIVRARALGLGKDDYSIQTVNSNKILAISEPKKLLDIASPDDLEAEQRVSEIKSGMHDDPDWMPAGLVRRTAESFKDPGQNAREPKESVDNQSVGDDAGQIQKAEESAHRTLGEMPEGSFAYKNVEDLSSADMIDLRRYWEKNLYKGSMAERTAGAGGPKGISRQAAWQKFVKESGNDKAQALAAIRQDLYDNHSAEDMFGEKDPPPLARVNPLDVKTFRGNVDGAAELFRAIDDLSDPKLVIDEAAAEKERTKLEAELPEKLTELYELQMRDHYLKFMSGHSEAEFTAGEERQEQSPWGEYVRLHGDVTRAQESVLDTIRGDFNNRFAKNYSKVAGVKLKNKVQKIRNARDHILGMLDKDMRDSFVDKFSAELSSAGATVANRSGGKFAAGSWKDKAIAYLEEKKKADAAQFDIFSGEDLKQDDGSEILSLGSRVESQLASIMPEISANVRRGQKFAVSQGMMTKGERQRAIKMFAATKRMNLTFGTGKGKTILSIGSFTELKAQGKVKRAIFAVPSVVQAQFGNECNVFCQPGKYKVKAEPNLDRAGRIAAMKDGNLDMVVMTHQSIRDDMIYIMGQHNSMDESAMKVHFNAQPEAERKRLLGEALKAEGIDFGMLTVDESHYTTNRQGKDDSTLANVMDALNQNVDYFMNQSATPVKNDLSEAYDMLHKVAPGKFNDRAEFMKRYGVDSEYSRRSLQRAINRYNYSSQTFTGVKRNETKESVSLSPEQQAEYTKIEEAAKAASKAQAAGTVDIPAMKYLSPGSFKNQPDSEHEAIARRLQRSAGVMKEEGLNRVVNRFDWHNNAKVHKVLDLVSSKIYEKDNPKTNSKAGDKKPGVIFAHNIKSVDNLREAMESRGIRVGIIQGSMNGSEKDRVKMGFNPPNPADRQYDVLLCSDAGATGLNLQNAAYLMNFDLPQTSWLKQQREGRIDRPGQAHGEIDYHDIVSDTEHESTKWDRIQRKKALGSIFEEDPGALDDTGLAAMIANVRADRHNQGMEDAA